MSGKNSTFRDWLAAEHPGAILLEPEHCDEGILGLAEGGRVVYGYDELVESYAKAFRPDAHDDEDAYNMGIEWVEFNTLRSLPYMGERAPVVVMFDPETELLVDQAAYGEYPEKEFEFERNCPGLVV